MSHFTTFLALMVSGMAVLEPVAAGNLAGLSARINLGLANYDTFQRRQTTTPQPPAECASVCNSVNGIISSGQCTPSECCSASFENSYFDCLGCAATILALTDYTSPQSTIDGLYDDCATLGIQLPVLTFPGQNANRTLSVVRSQTTISVTSLSVPYSPQTTISPATTTTSLQAMTTTTNTPTPTSTSSGITSVETGCFHLITSLAMILGTWLYFAVY